MAKTYYEDPVQGVGWNIDPMTGQAAAFWLDENKKGDPGLGSSYNPTRDYGLGSSSLGVIVVQRDANGTPTKYYAQTAGGGGQVFTDLSQAQEAARGYQAWDSERNPNSTKYQAKSTGVVSTTGGGKVDPNASSSTKTGTVGTTGELMTPGYGEQTWEKTQDQWNQPTALEQAWTKFNGTQAGPTKAEGEYESAKSKSGTTNAQSLWDGYAKTFSSPAGLEDIYNRKLKEASTNLNRRASSAGVGDSAAAARATGGLAQKFADQTVLATQDWAKTGMGLAGSADSSNLAQQGQLGQLASSADSSKLATDRFGLDLATGAAGSELSRMSGRQTAANSAQAAKQNRASGAIDAATGLGSAQAGVAASGLDSAAQQKFNTDLEALKMQVQKGNISAQEAYNKSSEWLKALGVTITAANSKDLMGLFDGNNPNWDPFADYKGTK